MTEPPLDDPFAKPPRAAGWAEPGRPRISPTPPGYSAPAPPPPLPPPPPPSGYSAPAQPGNPPPGYSAPAQPGYPPPGYSAPGYPVPVKDKSWMNILSLCMVPATIVAPVVANIVGIVFGHLGVRAASRGEAQNRSVGMAGLVLNYIIAIGAAVFLGGFFLWAVVECTNNPYGEFCSGSY